MLRASSDTVGRPLGASLWFDRISIFANVRACLADGLCPAGTQRNLQYAAPNARFAPAIGTAEQLLLADAQTSGGLLIAVDESILPALIAGLGDRGVQVAAPIGSIVEADLPGCIEVS